VSRDLFNLVVAAIYGLTFIGAAIILSWTAIQRKKNLDKAQDSLKTKLSAGLPLSAKEVVYIGRGFEVSPKSSRDVVYKLFSDTNDPKQYAQLKALVSEIEKEEPFDELPDEVKPSIARLARLVEHSDDPADKHVLLPITTALNKYVELKGEQEKAKKQTSRAYLITIISFVVGAISFYFTLKSPGVTDIKNVLEEVLVETAKTSGAQE